MKQNGTGLPFKVAEVSHLLPCHCSVGPPHRTDVSVDARTHALTHAPRPQLQTRGSLGTPCCFEPPLLCPHELYGQLLPILQDAAQVELGEASCLARKSGSFLCAIPGTVRVSFLPRPFCLATTGSERQPRPDGGFRRRHSPRPSSSSSQQGCRGGLMASVTESLSLKTVPSAACPD